MGYRPLHITWLIGLTLAMVIGMVYAYVYFITYGAMARARELSRPAAGGPDAQTSNINNNFSSPYNYQGVLGQVRLARTGQPPE